jgi:hypothetical protein
MVAWNSKRGRRDRLKEKKITVSPGALANKPPAVGAGATPNVKQESYNIINIVDNKQA